MAGGIMPNDLEAYFLSLINSARADAGVSQLIFDGELNVAADDHSDWMLANDTFSHVGANGSSVGDRLQAAEYGAAGWGENIAYRSNSGAEGMDEADVRALHQSLMDSPGHKANILNPNFTEVGVGLKWGDMAGWQVAMVTQDFGSPTPVESDEPDSPLPLAPAPVQTSSPGPAPAGQTINGGRRSETLYGTDGNDTIDGGRGNDHLTGGKGADTFAFKQGQGWDQVTDFGTDDVLHLKGMQAADVSIYRSGGDMILDFDRGGGVVVKDVATIAADDYLFI